MAGQTRPRPTRAFRRVWLTDRDAMHFTRDTFWRVAADDGAAPARGVSAVDGWTTCRSPCDRDEEVYFLVLLVLLERVYQTVPRAFVVVKARPSEKQDSMTWARVSQPFF